MGDYVWNGEQLLTRQAIRLDIEDRGYNFGDGVYEVFRVYNGKVFEEDLHWERLYKSAEAIHIKLPFTHEHLSHGLSELLQADSFSEGMVYLQVTRGVAPRSHAFPSADTKPVLIAYTRPLNRPVKEQQVGIKVITQPDIRWLRCDIKSLNLLPNLLAKQEAVEAGAEEALLHRDNMVTEGSASNVAIVKDGVIHTHPANHLILQGITREVMKRMANDLAIPLKEEAFALSALYAADEAFIMSTTLEIMPVIKVDNQSISSGFPGPVTKQLIKHFDEWI
jgi:D-alanine transaminase